MRRITKARTAAAVPVETLHLIFILLTLGLISKLAAGVARRKVVLVIEANRMKLDFFALTFTDAISVFKPLDFD